MKRDDVFPSKFLKASDLASKPVVVTIEAARYEALKTLDGKEQQKIVLYFVGSQESRCRSMVTNFSAVIDAVGEDDTDRWPGKQIELYASTTQMSGKTVPCIRIRPPAQRQLPKLQQASAPPSTVDEANPPPADATANDVPWLQ